MSAREIEMFVFAKHKSGVPYWRSKCCGSRINRQRKVVALDKPEIYGMIEPQLKTVCTHVADYSCKCGKTVIEIEGTMETLILHGCIADKKSESPAKAE